MFQIKDTIDETRYDIHKDFILASEDRERAYLEKTIREGKRWAEHTINQKPLTPGQPVLLQSMKGNDKGQWTSSGTVWTANPDISQYNIKMDGSGRLVLRNRTNLRPIEIQDAAQNKELELGGNAPPFIEVTPTTETKGPHEELNGETLSQPNDEVSPEMKSKAGERELTQDSRHSTLNQKDCTGDNPGILDPEPEEVRPQESRKEARSLKTRKHQGGRGHLREHPGETTQAVKPPQMAHPISSGTRRTRPKGRPETRSHRHKEGRTQSHHPGAALRRPRQVQRDGGQNQLGQGYGGGDT